MNNSSSSKFFRQGGNDWNLLDFDNQSAATICVDTIKYFSIPSVLSRLEEDKTRPHSLIYRPSKRSSIITNLNKQLKIFSYRRCGKNGENAGAIRTSTAAFFVVLFFHAAARGAIYFFALKIEIINTSITNQLTQQYYQTRRINPRPIPLRVG